MNGKVTDKTTGAPVAYANVYVSDTLGNPEEPLRGTTTDANGNYSLAVLPGSYVTASFVGFQKETKKSNGTVNFQLQSGVQLAEVEIVARKKHKYIAASGILLIAVISAFMIKKYIIIK